MRQQRKLMRGIARYGHVNMETALILTAITAGIISAAIVTGETAKHSFSKVTMHVPRPAAYVQDSLPVPQTSRSVVAETAAADAQPPVFFAVAAALGFAATGLTATAAYRMRKAKPQLEEIRTADSTVTAAHQSRLFQKRQNVLRILSQDTHALFEGRMTVGQLMSPNVHTVLPKMPVRELKALCREKQIRHVLVCDSNGALLGVVSDRDLAVRSGHSAADIMTRNPVTVGADSLVGPAMTTMLDKRVHCLPVIAAGEPCGMLTTSDLLMALQCALQLLAKASVSSRE